MKRGNIKVRFGVRIRTLREAVGLSQEDLAHAAGISRGYVSDVECGKRNIALENIAALAKALKRRLCEVMPDWPE